MNINIYSDENQYLNFNNYFLLDKNHVGKEKPWKEKKLKSLELGSSYMRLNLESKFNRSIQCGEYLTFKRFDDNTMNLAYAYFCQLRLCSMCSWRREMKIFSQVSKVINSINDLGCYRFLFLTLTCRNVSGEELSGQIDSLFKSFNKMFQRKIVKKSIKGWFRALEITHDVNKLITDDMYFGNKDKHLKSRENYYNSLDLHVADINPNYDMYHPHFHVILLVNKSYFKNKDYYIKQDNWTTLWKESLQCDYLPVVHIQPFKSSYGKEVAEVSKYTVKDGDFLVKGNKDLTDKTVLILDKALAYRRLVAFGGLLKEQHKNLNLSDVEKETDLVHIDEDGEIISDEVNYVMECYRWNIGYSNYVRF